MKVITTKLKRYKLIGWIATLLSLPIRLPLFLLIKIGEIAEEVLGVIDSFIYKIMHKIADVFKFEEIAMKQYETNKNKFKNF